MTRLTDFSFKLHAETLIQQKKCGFVLPRVPYALEQLFTKSTIKNLTF